MVGRAPDARRLATAFRHPTTPQIVFDPVLKIAAADLSAVRQVATAWLAWYDGLFAEPASPADDAWVPPGSIGASNTFGGPGTLVDGPATFELQLIVNGPLLETKTTALTLATGVVPSPDSA